METIKISNLQEGDLFMYKDVMYEKDTGIAIVRM